MGFKHSQYGHKSDVINIVLRSSAPLETRVSVGEGALETVGHTLKQSHVGSRVLLLTQEAVREQWAMPVFQGLEQLGFKAELMTLPDGEDCKKPEVLIDVWQRLQSLQFTRADALVAVGGGALSDLSGFAASTYLRGIKLVLVPTTLLAQVDAAIGGKTGINLAAGKNLAGSFYFPAGVAVDPTTLRTLPEREFKSGLGEIIKYAYIESTIASNTEYRGGPKSLFSVLEGVLTQDTVTADHPALPGIITACVKMKLAVVGKDPFEGRLRRCLNLGHTLGHAIEKVSAYSLTHGEAVAIGCVFACRVAASRRLFDQGHIERLIRMLDRAGLPSRVPENLAVDDLIVAMAFDKKRAGEVIKFVLPIEPVGTVDVDASLSFDELRKCLV